MEMPAPAGLYGMAIVEPAVLDRRLDGTFVYVVELMRVFGMLCLNYTVIGLFLLQLWKMNERQRVSDCSGHLLPLELGCVFLFEVRMLADIRKGLSILTLLWLAPRPAASDSTLLPTSKPNHRYRGLADSPKIGAVMVKEEATGEGAFDGLLARLSRKRRGGEDKKWDLDGLSRTFRVWCTCVVGLPKLAIDVALAYMGGVYIMQSDTDEAMLMNTLAVVFISEIEALLYHAFTSDVMRQSLESMRPVVVDMGNKKRLVMWLFCSILAPLATVFVALAMVSYTHRMDCPSFQLSWKLFSDTAQSFVDEAGPPIVA